MPSAYPPIVTPIVTRMEIEAECISVQGFRTLQVRDLQYDRHQPAVFGHLPSSPIRN